MLKSLTEIVHDGMMSDEARHEFHKVTYRGMQHDACSLHVKQTLNYYIRYEVRKAVLDALVAELLGDETAYRDGFYLSTEQIREMHSAGMIIGSHSVSHRVMSKLSTTEQERELKQSFEALEKATGGLTCRTFCYPYGGFHTFTAQTEELLNQVDCKFSFNVEPRDITATDIRNRPQALPRFDCNSLPHGACRDIAAQDDR
ncbi:MAG: polysaccharide deacetylase family protein [Planctomycetota bacterium]|nr:polysaccharide deacetylase family protein [Planctomycetota bacterium]